MIVEIVFCMILFICLLTTIQPDKERTRLTAVYGASLFAHWVLAFFVFSDGGELLFFTHGTLYFLSAAAVDLWLIKYIANSGCVTTLSGELQTVSIVSIFYNLGGWLLYLNESHVPVYNFMFVAVYLFAIYVLMKGEPKDARRKHIGSSRWFIPVRINDYTRNIIHFNH